MGKPNTRSKSKRQKPDENECLSSDILRKIYSTGEIFRDDVYHLYMVTKPCCQGCRVNSKDSPNCFCALVPPSNGARKTGLWQKIADIVEEIGPDPCKDLRSSSDFPAGLTNLGATCYANSILQCLYMNSSFRGGIFSVEPELLKQQVVIDKLARLFAQLHSSKMAFIDSAPFITSLELDNGAQQDSHEFFTLFLSLLEQSLSHSKVPKARTIVQDLFCGTMSHVTRCSVCGKESDASSKKEDFYGLELNVSGLNSLHESLDDYFSAEELQGENQYFCESCRKHVDATRSVKLHTLPSILNFQLKRCVFLSKTTTKKKLTSMFSFPRLLNMMEKLCDPAKLESVYELTAILIHKGTDVNSGHYVAHIKHERSGHWWKFDDEHVCDLGFNPFGERSSGSVKCKPQSTVQPACFGKEHFTVDNHVSNDEVFSSSDAYMLMYSRLSTKEIGIDGVDLDKSDFDLLPSHLLDDIEKLNAELNAASENYKKRKEAEVTAITTRREEVRSLLSEAAVQSLDDPFFWISTDWLRQWADTINPPPIDNATILCKHKKVSLSKVCSLKRLSEKAWHKLLAKYGGGPELNHDDYCIICLKDVAKSTVSAENFRDCRSSMMELAEAALAGNWFDEQLYYVSKTWLLQWVRRRNADSPCDADAGPTASLCCPHGELLPELAVGAKRVVVPESLWLFFLESAKAVKPDDLLGCVTFPMGSEPCSSCCVELIEIASLEDNLRGVKLKQRQNHEKLFLGKSIALFPGCRYYLLPSSWLTKWRAFIASGKNASSHLEPELYTVMESLICQKVIIFL